ncbi:hypothetical protein ACTXT7_015061 [Hymenolepis weldensis]
MACSIRDIYDDNMVDLPFATSTAILLRKRSRSDHDQYLAYLRPIDHTDLTYDKAINYNVV